MKYETLKKEIRDFNNIEEVRCNINILNIFYFLFMNIYFILYKLNFIQSIIKILKYIYNDKDRYNNNIDNDYYLLHAIVLLPLLKMNILELLRSVHLRL